MDELVSNASAADRHPAVVQGQEDLSGVKSVEIKRAIKKNSEEEYVVTQSTRTEMVYDTAELARNAYLDIHDAKEEAEFDEKEMDKIDEPEKQPVQEPEESPEKDLKSAALGSKLHATAAVPPDMEKPLVGDFNALQGYDAAQPMAALETEAKKAEDLVSEIASSVAAGIVREENDELDNKFFQAEKAIQNCIYLAWVFNKDPRYQHETNHFYDAAVALKEKLDKYANGDMDTAQADEAKNIEQSKQPQLPFEDGVIGSWVTELARQAAPYGYTADLGMYSGNVQPAEQRAGNNPSNQNDPRVTWVTRNDGYNGGGTPEHTQVGGTYAFYANAEDEGKEEIKKEDPQHSLLQPDFEVSPMETELRNGVRREFEHTDDAAKAVEIALDHLAEDKEYYTKLQKVMPEFGTEEKKERELFVNPEDSEVKEYDYDKAGKETMFPGMK